MPSSPSQDSPAPRTSNAMKAVLTDERFSDPGWIYERKLDGIRCAAIRDGAAVTMLSRNDLSLNGRYPNWRARSSARPAAGSRSTARSWPSTARQTSFARLAQRHERPVAVFLYLFDIVWLDGQDVRDVPLRARKGLLRETLSFVDPIRFSAHRNEHGEAFFAEACRKGWEGVIAKRADSAYTASRSRDWLKLKCDRSQELVIGGYTAPKGSREELGALLLGYHSGAELLYAGKVGTGFDRQTLRDLGARLGPLRRADAPFADPRAIKERTATWVAPELVAQVGFMEWTRDGRLRHPRFLGLRFDKPPADVVREG